MCQQPSTGHQPPTILISNPPNTHRTDGLSYHPAATTAIAYLDDTAQEDEQSSKSRVAGAVRLNALRPHKVGYQHEYHRLLMRTPHHMYGRRRWYSTNACAALRGGGFPQREGELDGGRETRDSVDQQLWLVGCRRWCTKYVPLSLCRLTNRDRIQRRPR